MELSFTCWNLLRGALLLSLFETLGVPFSNAAETEAYRLAKLEAAR